MNGRGAPTTFRRAELGSAPGATSSAMDVPPPTRVGPSGARPTANRHFALASGTRPYHPRYDRARFALRGVVRATCLTRCGPVRSAARKMCDGEGRTNTPARAPTNPSADGRFDRRPRGNCPPGDKRYLTPFSVWVYWVLGIGKMAPSVAGGSTQKPQSDLPLRSEAVSCILVIGPTDDNGNPSLTS